jgi:N-methylhydantoinase B
MNTALGINATFDPITAEVIRSGLENIAREMSAVLIRTSGSPVLTEAKDFSTVIFNEQQEQLAIAGYVLFHVASSRAGVRAVAARRLPNDIAPGDAFICNDPYTSGAVHQGDVGIVMPIFLREKLVGWSFANAHLIDVGGMAIGGIAPLATDCFEEALRFPGNRIARNGSIDPEWQMFACNNVRVPLSFINDVRSLIAACGVGANRVCRLIEEYGVEAYEAYNATNIQLSEKAFRDRIALLPKGTYRTYDWIEYDGRGKDDLYPLACELTVTDSKLCFSFSGCPQVAAFVNAARPALEGQVMVPILCMLAHDIPFNEGIWRAIEIDVGQPGTVVNPVPPAPVSNAHMEGGVRVCRMVEEAISAVCSLSDLPELKGRVAGQAANCMTGAAWFGKNARNETSVFMPLDLASGTGGGAQSVGDGQDMYGYQCMLGCSYADVEVHELNDPFLILWRRIHLNSGGAGQTRGGQALDTAYIVWEGSGFVGNGFVSSVELPARGFGGGQPGSGAINRVIRSSNVRQLLAQGTMPTSPELLDGRIENLPGKVNGVPLAVDDVYWGLGAGGGGLGDPFLRNPELVNDDLVTGKITESAATYLYGAVIVAGRVDVDATWANRDALREAIVPTKLRSLRELVQGLPSASVRVVEGSWICERCATRLGPADQNWRNATPHVRRNLADHFDRAGVQIRRRPANEVMLLEHYCPKCASCLSVDFQLDQEPDMLPQCQLNG